MKDKQVEPASTQSRIPVISAVLHCVSMPALVYLRSSFGYAYLGPKSVFFAFSWAFILFAIYAWNEPEIWRSYRAVWGFGVGAVALYWIHLFSAFGREFGQDSEHDTFSGRSHPLRLGALTRKGSASNLEATLHLWVEPAAILITAGALRLAAGEHRLSQWLVITAGCLWAKEIFNYWHRLRSRKRQRDIFVDADDGMEPPGTGGPEVEMPKGTRKEKVKRPRNSTAPEREVEEQRAAELLRLLPPYSLETAEANYHTLIKMEHPDAQEGGVDSTSRASDLNGAIAYFRTKLGG